MDKRKCGTCRFFQDAEIACSGWCTHPERSDLHDLVLVRRAELACRNSWDRDLWEPATEAPRKAPLQMGVAASGSQQSVLDNPTDQVTAIDISRPISTAKANRRHPAVTGGQGSPYVGSGNIEQAESQARQRSESRARVSSLEPSFASALRGPKWMGGHSREGESDSASVEVVVANQRKEPSPPAPRFVGFADRGHRGQGIVEDTAEISVADVNRLIRQRQEVVVESQPPSFSAPPSEASTPGSSPVVHVDDLSGVQRRNPVKATPGEAATRNVATSPSPLDESSWASAIPRCCDTCREYYRDPSGQQGYCRSPYAFTSRTMVKSDQLACRSSIGVWWLPNDDAWSEKADVTHHTRPTPYLDAILKNVRRNN